MLFLFFVYGIISLTPKNKKTTDRHKSFLRALEVDFKPLELTEREKAINLYGKELVETVERGREDIKAGRTVTYTMEELKQLRS